MREMTVIRINATLDEVPKSKKEKLVEGRLDLAMERAGYKTDVALCAAIKVKSSTQVKRWRERKTTPEGRTYARLCGVLGLLPGWLFGEDLSEEEARKEVADMLENSVGKPEADALRLLGRVPPEMREKVVESIAVFATKPIVELRQPDLIPPRQGSARERYGKQPNASGAAVAPEGPPVTPPTDGTPAAPPKRLRRRSPKSPKPAG